MHKLKIIKEYPLAYSRYFGKKVTIKNLKKTFHRLVLGF
jgi:hypothetical protein